MCVSQVWNLSRAEALTPHFLGQVEEFASSGGGWLSLDLRAPGAQGCCRFGLGSAVNA